MLLREYINALILNVDKTKIPNEIDLVFSGGAFNGMFGFGVLYYIKALEKQKLITVVRVSGCSIGSLLALWYLTDYPEDPDVWLTNIISGFKKKQNLTAYHENIRKTVYKLFENDTAVKSIDGYLFISFYDMKK